MSLLGKKVLVVGGNGFVGNYFASRLVQQAATVSCLSRYSITQLEKVSNTTFLKIVELIG
jgi:nucleoside-diphosphate-sugar epimerase